MAWLAVDENLDEFIYEEKPFRKRYNLGSGIWCDAWYKSDWYVLLPKGSIEKLIGKTMSWEDDTVEIL